MTSVAADDLDADIVEQLRKLNRPEELLFSAMVTFSEEVADLSVAVALQWTNGETGHISSYANDSPTTRGGAHVEGFSRALTEAVKAYAIASGLVGSAGDILLGDDIRQGLTAIIRTHCDDPWFEPIHDDGINGRKLGTVKMREFVYWTTRPRLSSWLEEHPTEANLIVQRAISAAHDRVSDSAQRGQSR